MCGIVAIVSRLAERPAPTPDELLALLDEAVAAITASPAQPFELLAALAEPVEVVDALLHGVPGIQALVAQPALGAAMVARLDRLDEAVERCERLMESGDATTDAEQIERLNAAVVRARDSLWAVRHDRLRTARAVADLAGREAVGATLAAYSAVQMALSALDRLEVRGRDSAGLHVMVWGHGLDLEAESVQTLLTARSSDPLFTSGSVRVAGGVLSFVYKAAAEIGELGDNTARLRATIRDDALLRLAVQSPSARVTVLAHTRWASVGIISEPNAHPLNQEEDEATAGPYVVAALNGDVDNHADLKAQHGLRLPPLITTDAKVIPALVSRHAGAANDLTEAFRRTVASFEGSVAIAAGAAPQPDRVWLALRGSGQALYVGLAESAFVVASEPYGLVEETCRYVRMDGETPLRPGEPATRGQIMVLDGTRAGEVAGIRRLAYDGTELPLTDADVVTAQVTTRDIDRGSAPHFFLKEITEAPGSFHKTLRGKIVERDGLLRATMGERALPGAVRERLRDGRIRRVVAVGQGTAAVAGRAFAQLLRALVGDAGLAVQQMTATEFSGFHLRQDLSDTLVVAVSQSGTTTDTNRTVDLARARGATVLGIVNRRNSDLCDKADGVLYTSDGRDVEMSVASTKAFYAQVAAGALLACAVAELVNPDDAPRRHELLHALREMPVAMAAVLQQRGVIADAARRFAPARRYWAVVGNGPNRVAADEVRIKLSELCYKSIACDDTEDKKHIDLSSEPLIVVCAAGLSGGTADDVAKEVAIYRAHKAAPIVIASEGEERFQAALQVLSVPAVAPELAFVLATMAGHLFGYEAALAIDALARPLRHAREAVEEALAEMAGLAVLSRLRVTLVPWANQFFDQLRSNHCDGQLEASTAVRLASLLRYATGMLPLEAYEIEHGKVGTPEVIVDDLTAALTRAIEELTRPVDAIKHQAKTVTVGISRSDEGLLAAPLVRAVLDAGAGRDRLSYRTLQGLAGLSPAVADVRGYTRYRIDGDPTTSATVQIVDRGGIALDIPSRVERNAELRGTKRWVAVHRDLLVARGRADGRTVVLVPEVKGNQTTGITLLHVQLAEHLDAPVARAVLDAYDDRYNRLRDTVTETEPVLRDDLLEGIPAVDLLTLPVSELAERWRSS